MMSNQVGLKDLFNGNIKAIKQFLAWIENNDEFCEWDLEYIKTIFELNAHGLTDKFIHFHNGNILDWLEELGYKIGLPIRNGKYVTCVYYKNNRYPIYNNSGNAERNKAITVGIQKAIEHYENN